MPKLAIRLQNVEMLIEGEIPPEVREDIRRRMSYIVPGHEFMPGFKKAKYATSGKEPWDGTKTVAIWQRGGGLKAPTGLLSYLRECLSEHGLEYSIIDERPVAVPSPGWSTPDLKLRDYQLEEMVAPMLNKQRGVLKASTGSGKTECLVDTFVKASCFPAIFYVTSCDLLRQAKSRFEKYALYNGEPAKIGCIGDGKCDLQPITIATVQSCQKALEGSFTKYAFDDFSADDDIDLDDKQKAQVRDFVKQAQFVYVDECFVGHTLVTMPDGSRETISKLVNSKYSGEVLSFSERTKRFEPQKVTGWIKKKPTTQMVKVSTGRIGGISCTDNHEFLTARGWVMAKNLKVGDGIIYRLADSRTTPAMSEIGKQIACGTILGDGCLMKPEKPTKNSRLVMTHGIKQKGYLEFKTKFLGGTHKGYRWNKSGYTGKKNIIQGYSRTSYEFSQMLKTGKLNVINNLTLHSLAVHYLDDGCYSPDNNGTGMLAVCAMKKNLREALVKRMKFLGVEATPRYSDKKRGWSLYIPRRFMESAFGKAIAEMAPDCMRYKVPKPFKHVNPLNVTKSDFPDYGYITVRSVKPVKQVDTVYCLKVAKNNNFVANNCVVHNCHHVSSETVQCIMKASDKARFRIGGSASPWRDDGLDILIEACFGKRLCDISASFLINRGFLVRPEITFNHFRQALGTTGNFQSHYTKYVVENDPRNQFIAQRAIYHTGLNRPTIVLVKFVSHAERLKELIPGAEILASSGKAKKTPKQREEYLNMMRSRELMCVIATSLLDEGVDVPAASVGIFAGGGKSSTRELQRVGRVIRPDPVDKDKNKAWIEEFTDHTKWLNHHAKERRRILETEKAFEIKDNKSTMIL